MCHRSVDDEHGFLFRGGAVRVDPHGVVLEGFPVGSDNYICATTTLVVDESCEQCVF
jgi:hypothetical protein